MTKIFKVSQNVNNDYGTYDSFVCCTETKEQAQHMYPSEYAVWSEEKGCFVDSDDGDYYHNFTWCQPDDVIVEYLGESTLPVGMVLTSFNAG